MDRIKNKEFELVKIPTEDNRADLFTKLENTPFPTLEIKTNGGGDRSKSFPFAEPNQLFEQPLSEKVWVG